MVQVLDKANNESPCHDLGTNRLRKPAILNHIYKWSLFSLGAQSYPCFHSDHRAELIENFKQV